MQGLCDVRPAVVQNDGAGSRIVLRAVVRGLRHFAQIGSQIVFGNLQIQKARHDGLGAGKQLIFAQRVQNRICDLDGSLMILLCRCQRTVALVFTEIRAVGKRRFAIGRVKPSPLKCTCQLLGDQIDQKFHACHPLSCHNLLYYNRTHRGCTEKKEKPRSNKASFGALQNMRSTL